MLDFFTYPVFKAINWSLLSSEGDQLLLYINIYTYELTDFNIFNGFQALAILIHFETLMIIGSLVFEVVHKSIRHDPTSL